MNFRTTEQTKFSVFSGVLPAYLANVIPDVGGISPFSVFGYRVL